MSGGGISMANTAKLDFHAKEQLYSQLHDILYQDIVKHVYKVGDLIPSESELIRQYGVSRITVRRAMEMLSQVGLIEKRRGVGSVVVSNAPKTSPQRVTDYIRRNPCTEGSAHKEVVSAEILPAPRAIAQEMGLMDRTPLFRLCRLHYEGSVKASIETNWYEHAVFPEIIAHDFARESLRSYVENDCHVVWTHAIQTIGAAAATAEQAELLGISEGNPLLHIGRKSFDTMGVVREVVEHYFLPRHCELEIHLER